METMTPQIIYGCSLKETMTPEITHGCSLNLATLNILVANKPL